MIEHLHGLTPARAGNTPHAIRQSASERAHPRTGGEHSVASHIRPAWSGSPPHGRGTHVGVSGRVVGDGLTPARAGNTDCEPSAALVEGAHPRTGGEHSESSSRARSRVGSPPHGRGTRSAGCPSRTVVGLTPARAGNTEGAHSMVLPLNWLTPARAGNTVARRDRAFRWRAHPRTGGEHHHPPPPRHIVEGSPPHGRGTQRRGPRCRPGEMAHPRTGGEHTRVV